MQIHEAIARGVDVPGWELPENNFMLVRRTDGSDGAGEDLLENRNGKLFNKVLNVEVSINGCKQINIDETSIDPNETLGMRLEMENCVASSWKGNRTDTETAMIESSACGDIRVAMIIRRGKSIDGEYLAHLPFSKRTECMCVPCKECWPLQYEKLQSKANPNPSLRTAATANQSSITTKDILHNYIQVFLANICTDCF